MHFLLNCNMPTLLFSERSIWIELVEMEKHVLASESKDCGTPSFFSIYTSIRGVEHRGNMSYLDSIRRLFISMVDKQTIPRWKSSSLVYLVSIPKKDVYTLYVKFNVDYLRIMRYNIFVLLYGVTLLAAQNQCWHGIIAKKC